MFIFVIIGWLLTCCGPLMWSHVCLLEFNELRVWCEFTYHFTSLLLLHIFELRTWELGLIGRRPRWTFIAFSFLVLWWVLLAHGDSFCLLFFFFLLYSFGGWLEMINMMVQGEFLEGNMHISFFFFFFIYLFIFFCFSKYVLCGFCLTLYSGNA